MGVDFLKRTAKTLERKFDRCLEDLSTPDLFTRVPNGCGRVAVAEPIENEKVSEGERLVIRRHGDAVVAQRGITNVAKLVNPEPSLLEAMHASSVAEGTVSRVHELSGVIELEVR